MTEEWLNKIEAAIHWYAQVRGNWNAGAGTEKEIDAAYADVSKLLQQAMTNDPLDELVDPALSGLCLTLRGDDQEVQVDVDPWPPENGQLGVRFANGRRRLFDAKTGDEVTR